MDCPNDLPQDINELKQLVSLLRFENKQLSQKNMHLAEDKEQLSQRHIRLVEENEQLEKNNQALEQQIAKLTEEIEVLKERLKILQAKQYGSSSEKIKKEIEATQEQLKKIEAKRKQLLALLEKKQPKRVELDPKLPREEEIIPAPQQCECGSKNIRNFSSDISEVLVHVPSSFKVKRYIRPRCICNDCGKFLQGYAPSNTIDKGKADAGVLAHVLVNKYCYHLPLYRQEQIYEHQGVKIARSTMCHWVSRCAELLNLLADKIKSYIFTSTHIHGDDTPIKVLAKGKTKESRIWVYLKTQLPYNNSSPPAACYFYSDNRKKEYPAQHMANFRGVLHADCYQGYDLIIERNNIQHAACWAHVRRYFYESALANHKAAVARYSLAKIARIYRIEQRIKRAPLDLLPRCVKNIPIR